MPSSVAVADSPAGFADRVRSALIWRWGSQVVMQVITWTATIVVVRLLEPSDYGLFAMTQALLTALNFLNGYSFATSLIQAETVDERRIGQVFSLLIVSNALLAMVQFACAPLAADYYGQPLIADMLRVQSLVYISTPLIALPSALLARKLDFRRQAIVNLFTAITGASVSLGLAWLGFGVWALVWAPIAMFWVRGIGLTLLAGGLVKPVFDFRGARDIVTFGTTLTLCQLFWIIQSQSDIVIAGRSFDPHQLGLYSESLFLVLIFTGRFLPPLNEVAFPAFAELHNAGRPIGPAFVAGIGMIMLVAVPFHIGLSLVAGPLVTTFFGPKWLEMIPIVAGLAIVMPLMALQIACAPATNALGRPGIYLATSAAGAVIMPTAYLIGVQGGAMGLVTAWQVAAPVLLLVTLALTLPAIGARAGELLLALLPSFSGSAVMAGAVMAVQPLVEPLPALARLAILGGVGFVVYCGAIRLIWPQLWRDALVKLRRQPATAPAPDGQTTTMPGSSGA
ncbi:MAG: lipopolysaccharide biosynthesis protein [Novosphingobium sp.]